MHNFAFERKRDNLYFWQHFPLLKIQSLLWCFSLSLSVVLSALSSCSGYKWLSMSSWHHLEAHHRIHYTKYGIRPSGIPHHRCCLTRYTQALTNLKSHGKENYKNSNINRKDYSAHEASSVQLDFTYNTDKYIIHLPRWECQVLFYLEKDLTTIEHENLVCTLEQNDHPTKKFYNFKQYSFLFHEYVGINHSVSLHCNE